MRRPTVIPAQWRLGSPSCVPGAPRRLLVLLLAIGVMFLVDTGSALGVEVHNQPPSSFGIDGTSATGFDTGSGSRIAIDQATKRLYVGQSRQPSEAIYGFDIATPGTRTPLAGFAPFKATEFGTLALAVDNSSKATAGTVYFTEKYSSGLSRLKKISLAGTPTGGALVLEPFLRSEQFTNAPVAETDPAGNIWGIFAESDGTQGVNEFSATGEFLRRVVVSGGPVRSIRFDAAGDLIVSVANTGVLKFSAPAYNDPVLLRSQPGPIAVDRATGDLFVVEPVSQVAEKGSRVLRLSPSGQPIESFTAAVRSSGGGVRDIAVDENTDSVYLLGQELGPNPRELVFEFKASNLPFAFTGEPTPLSDSSARLQGTVRPDGLTLTDCHFEYVTEAAFEVSGFEDLTTGGSAPCEPPFGSIPPDSETHSVSATVNGLSTGVSYRFRLVAAAAGGSNAGQAAGFQLGPPLLETTGAPVRGATTARLTGRVDPHGEPTTYHFEYGNQGPCASSPCLSSPAKPAGTAGVSELVAEEVEELEPDTTYHFRLVAENGVGAPALGDEMTVTTRASGASLSHGNLPGPPGSDRAYELVSIADSSGNPLFEAYGFAASGEAALYEIFGGTPISNSGGAFSLYYAKRPDGAHPETGWQTKLITPSREDLIGPQWLGEKVFASEDLSTVVAPNSAFGKDEVALWELAPEHSAAARLFLSGTTVLEGGAGGFAAVGLSADGSHVVATLKGGTIDPAYPAASSVSNIYDIGASPPRLVSLLPGNMLATCGIGGGGAFGNTQDTQSSHFVSADGSLVYFPSRGDECKGPSQIYLRDIGAEETSLISGPPVSGPACDADFLKGTPGAAFFATETDLDPADTSEGGCKDENNDVYRYDIASGDLECVTCAAPGLRAGVIGGATLDQIAVADDGSRVYFTTTRHLLPGAPPDGTQAVYRADVGSGALAYVAAPGVPIGPERQDAFLNADGSRLVFRSSAASLDPLGGASDNGGTPQYYLYDDEDRSLTCVSCPPDGSAPVQEAAQEFRVGTGQTGVTPLSDAGDFAFATATPLVGADQNTPSPGQSFNSAYGAGTDVYEWRDGRPLLVTSGLEHWTAPIPRVEGISPSGRDLFFSAAAQYTPDALDGLNRLYDARIGGGMNFPPAPKPCPLEVCQGTPRGAPEEQPPGTSDYRGPGNRAGESAGRCTKGKARRHGRCVTRGHKPKRHGHKRKGRANATGRRGR